MEPGEDELIELVRGAVGAGSGIELDRHAFHLWRTKDGAAIEFRAFLDRDAALAAARE